MNALGTMLKDALIVIARGIYGARALALARALINGGVRAIEFTFDLKRSDARALTAEAIARVKADFGKYVCVGAGTVVSAELVNIARDAGAEFIVSPDSNAEVICATKELGMVSIPGAFTPGEILKARGWGADIVKLFPAGALGAGYFKAVCAPINHIPIFAVGGVDNLNAREFMRSGAAGLGVGGYLANIALIDAGELGEIERRARAITNITGNTQGGN